MSSNDISLRLLKLQHIYKSILTHIISKLTLNKPKQYMQNNSSK